MKKILKALLLVSMVVFSNPNGLANDNTISSETTNLSVGIEKRRRNGNRSSARGRNRGNRNRRAVRNRGAVRNNRRAVRNNRRAVRTNRRAINRSFRRNTHAPYRRFRTHHNRYNSRRAFNRSLNRSHVYRNRWVRWATNYNNGYYWDNYPFFVYNGYRHRYSNVDRCDYELVDSYDEETVRDFSGYSCNVGYDRCAEVRDEYNYDEEENRYFCSETSDNF
jgi:hypothetical protein